MTGKTHYKFSNFESMCGIEFIDKPEKFRENIQEVTCASCKKIVTVFRSDSYNRPKKNIAKRSYNIKDNSYVRNYSSQHTDASNDESKNNSSKGTNDKEP